MDKEYDKAIRYSEPCYLLKLREEAIKLKQYHNALLKIELVPEDANHNDMLTYFDSHIQNKIENIKNKMIQNETQKEI